MVSMTTGLYMMMVSCSSVVAGVGIFSLLMLLGDWINPEQRNKRKHRNRRDRRW